MDQTRTQRFIVRSSDVLSEMRVSVEDESSGKVIWCKERYLTEDEIVEHIIDNVTSRVLWTVHRPTRGWYIRLRSPSFTSGIFIPLLPLPKSAPHYVPAGLSFGCRTNARGVGGGRHVPRTMSMETDSTLRDDTAPSSPIIGAAGEHSYPPANAAPYPSVVISPPSPTKDSGPAPGLRIPRTPSQITEFYLAPLSQPQPRANTSFLSRALSAFRTNTSHHSNSFSLFPVIPISTNRPPIPPSSSALPTHHDLPLNEPVPLLTFHDRTPVLTMRSLTGFIEIDREMMLALGVETSFWVAVALTYLEFLEERESYLAAISD